MEPGKITFTSDSTGSRTAYATDSNVLGVAVRNIAAYSARSPAVIIEFRDAAIRRNMHRASKGWAAIEYTALNGDIRAIQWDGGPDYAIHGNSTRHLPDINLQGLHADPGATMLIKLLADGYSRQEISLEISFRIKTPAGWHHMESEWL